MKDWIDEEEDRYLDESEAIYDEKYKSLSAEESLKRQIRGEYTAQTRLKKFFVKPHQKLTTEEATIFLNVISTAKDERIVQEFLDKHPFVLTSKMVPAHHGQYCISKPKLGSEYTPDFLMAGLDSSGLWWYGVELENPNERMFTKTGEITQALNHALRQVDDWRRWLREHLNYARTEYGYVDIDGELPCYVVIGKRENERIDQLQVRKRQREIMKKDRSGLFLHHYEWLSETDLTVVDMKTGNYVDDIG